MKEVKNEQKSIFGHFDLDLWPWHMTFIWIFGRRIIIEL